MAKTTTFEFHHTSATARGGRQRTADTTSVKARFFVVGTETRKEGEADRQVEVRRIYIDRDQTPPPMLSILDDGDEEFRVMTINEAQTSARGKWYEILAERV